MLLVLFNIGEHRYGLDTKDFVEIIPAIKLTDLPGTPDYIPGFFDYRGTIIPVIDIAQLVSNTPAKRLLSTRIILIELDLHENRKSIVGLIAEKMTDILEVEDDKLEETGARSKGSEYLGPIVRTPSGIIQCIILDKLINDELKKVLQSKAFKPE